jgi:hypothetical protein
MLIALLGHLLNQPQASNRTASLERTPTAPKTKTEAAQQSPPPRKSAIPQRSRVAYTVTHKHRLRDCHGTLTFTQEGLRFESDEPQDSFAVGLNDVTVDGDALRIRNRTWLFEFDDAVSAQRIFEHWKLGSVPAAATR